LRLKAEITAKQTSENEEALKTVPVCEKMNRVLVCARSAVATYTADLNQPAIPLTATVDEVTSALNIQSGYPSGVGGPWHSKPATDEVCFIGSDNKESCRKRATYIASLNSDMDSKRKSAQQYLPEQNDKINTNQPKFESLKCEAVLQKYSPDLPTPGCG